MRVTGNDKVVLVYFIVGFVWSASASSPARTKKKRGLAELRKIGREEEGTEKVTVSGGLCIGHKCYHACSYKRVAGSTSYLQFFAPVLLVIPPPKFPRSFFFFSCDAFLRSLELPHSGKPAESRLGLLFCALPDVYLCCAAACSRAFFFSRSPPHSVPPLGAHVRLFPLPLRAASYGLQDTEGRGRSSGSEK